jgi:acetate kinase
MPPESPPVAGTLLAVNTGSSSLKIAVYGNDLPLTELCRVSVERIGAVKSRVTVTRPRDETSLNEPIEAPNHRSALLNALEYAHRSFTFKVEAVGHRVVHGGTSHAQPEVLTAALLADLQQLATIDPDHMPQALDAIDTVARRYPDVPQVTCFDTAFHRTMPIVAQQYPLPPWTAALGIRRYGFHGLSCEFIVSALERLAPDALNGRLLIAHLGNGASVTAVQHGVSVDTTMGFSPTGGLMMGTRSGDLDPTVLTQLARVGHRDPDALHRLVNDEAGLLGVSGISGDVRDLLGQPEASPAAAAIELFCYTARKHMAALAGVLNGLDTIVFTGGIGEHAPQVRERICGGLGYLGVQLDPTRNGANHDVISASRSRVVVRVIPTDEELVIARHVRALVD